MTHPRMVEIFARGRPCEEGYAFCGEMTPEEVWATCNRPSWMVQWSRIMRGLDAMAVLKVTCEAVRWLELDAITTVTVRRIEAWTYGAKWTVEMATEMVNHAASLPEGPAKAPVMLGLHLIFAPVLGPRAVAFSVMEDLERLVDGGKVCDLIRERLG